MLHLLRDELIPRDAGTLAPPSPEVLDGLGGALGITVDGFFLDLYRVFGGRAAPDEHMVALWSPERIVAERAAAAIDGRRYFAVGDVMIDSDLLMVCLEDAGAPAYLRYAGDRIADSAVDLVEAVFAGRLRV